MAKSPTETCWSSVRVTPKYGNPNPRSIGARSVAPALSVSAILYATLYNVRAGTFRGLSRSISDWSGFTQVLGRWSGCGEPHHPFRFKVKAEIDSHLHPSTIQLHYEKGTNSITTSTLDKNAPLLSAPTFASQKQLGRLVSTTVSKALEYIVWAWSRLLFLAVSPHYPTALATMGEYDLIVGMWYSFSSQQCMALTSWIRSLTHRCIL